MWIPGINIVIHRPKNSRPFITVIKAEWCGIFLWSQGINGCFIYKNKMPVLFDWPSIRRSTAPFPSWYRIITNKSDCLYHPSFNQAFLLWSWSNLGNKQRHLRLPSLNQGLSLLLVSLGHWCLWSSVLVCCLIQERSSFSKKKLHKFWEDGSVGQRCSTWIIKSKEGGDHVIFFWPYLSWNIGQRWFGWIRIYNCCSFLCQSEFSRLYGKMR